MSTRSTIWCSPHGVSTEIHLYEEMIDDTIRLSIVSGPFDCELVLPPSLLASLLSDPRVALYARTGSAVKQTPVRTEGITQWTTPVPVAPVPVAPPDPAGE